MPMIDAKSGQRSTVCLLVLPMNDLERIAPFLYHVVCMANNHDKHPTQKIFSDKWYRFNRYEITGGYIRPAPAAKLELYEPWKLFRAPTGKEGIKQPYEPLLQLAK